MLNDAGTRELLESIFEKEALVIGGLAATGALEDEPVWQLIRSLDAIRQEALRSLGDADGGADGLDPARSPERQPHPAVEEFLLKIRRS